MQRTFIFTIIIECATVKDVRIKTEYNGKIKIFSLVLILENLLITLPHENREEKQKESKLLWGRNYIISEQNKHDLLSKIKIKLKNPNKKIRV